MCMSTPLLILHAYLTNPTTLLSKVGHAINKLEPGCFTAENNSAEDLIKYFETNQRAAVSPTKRSNVYGGYSPWKSQKAETKLLEQNEEISSLKKQIQDIQTMMMLNLGSKMKDSVKRRILDSEGTK